MAVAGAGGNSKPLISGETVMPFTFPAGSYVTVISVIDVIYRYDFYEKGYAMKKTTFSFLGSFLAPALAFLLTACGGGGGSGSEGSGSLSLSITDAPVSSDDIAEVWVRFTEVIVKPSNGEAYSIPITDDQDNPSYRDIELTSLGSGKATLLLGQEPLPAGNYSWLRLVIDPKHTYVVDSTGGESLLDCSSCTQSNLKLNRTFTVVDNGVVAFTIDFDLRKSLTLTQPHAVPPYPDHAIKLRPTLRIVETELAGNFSGEVDEALITGEGIDTSILLAGDPTGCSVYVFEGFDANPDDIYMPDDFSVGGHNNPVAITDVTKEDIGGFVYVYTAAYLVAGEYTAALTCDAGNDDPDTDEANVSGGDPDHEVIFLDQQNVLVGSGTTTENVDFPVVP